MHMSTSSSVSFDTYERDSAPLPAVGDTLDADSDDWDAVLSDWAEVRGMGMGVVHHTGV